LKINQNSNLSLDTLAADMFASLAHSFPVACASDEFYYFPQVQNHEEDWRLWDDFSSEKIAQVVDQLSHWKYNLDHLSSAEFDLQTQIDIDILRKLAHTLREYLWEVRTWESQPTFYLTIVLIGMVEAIGSNESEAKHLRAKNLPQFLDQAALNLKSVPVIFRDLAFEMLSDTKVFLKSLEKLIPEMGDALPALDRFEKTLQTVSIRYDFFHSPDLIKRIMSSHLQIEMDLKDLENMLDQEIEEMKTNLRKEMTFFVGNQFDERPFNELLNETLDKIPGPATEENDLIEIYKKEVTNLAKHCAEQGLISSKFFKSIPIQVAPMPFYLSAIRAASSYSISPRFLDQGGIFYVLNSKLLKDDRQSAHREYRLLSAHETYPGHHVLDTSRWHLARSVRRHIESPLFYEGWSCFAEELMRLTGYINTTTDRFLLYKRRLWRAIRGKVDLGLQTGSLDISGAARYLEETGVTKEKAQSSATKYLLNPGYQLCYTIGLHRFLELFNRYGTHNLAYFTHSVLEQGEVGFRNLEKFFKSKSI
jgi:uncharacterized protein (DUF885 family)